MLDATTDESSSYNESVYNTPNITTKRKLSVKNRSIFFFNDCGYCSANLHICYFSLYSAIWKAMGCS